MIDIKDIQGNVILSVSIATSSQKVEELMGSDYIQLSWNSNIGDVLPLGSYMEYEGEKYSLLEPYTPSQKNEVEYTYNPQFKSRVMAWGKMPFFFYSGESKEPDWTLTSNPADFMKMVLDSILKEAGESWTYSIDASLPASASLSFSSVDILSGLNQIASAFETEWYADKSTNTLYLGLLSHGEEVTLKVGENINVPSVQGNREGYYTRFYAFGSTRNITQDYEGSNTNNLVNKRLTLDPTKYPNGYKDIREGLSGGEIFSKVLIFDDVYPSADLSISGVRNRLMYRLDSNGDKVQLGTDDSGNPIYDQYAIWYFRIEGFDFDLSNIIEGYNLSVSFQSGALQEREFELKYYEEDSTISTSDGSTFQARKGDYEILFVEEGGYIIPSLTGLVPSDGDSVVLFNIKMPSEYTQSAYNKLEERLDKEIERLSSDLNNYTFKSNPVSFNESNPNLSIGRKVKYVNGDYSYSTRVIKLTTQLDYPIEQDITIGNEKVKGNTQQLKEEVASANKDLNLLAVFNDMTQSIQQSYARTQQMMLEGFAAIKNIWQLKTDENGNTYAFSAFDVVSQKGMTMYADGALLNLPSIYAGLPIDDNTIYWENGVLKAVGGGGTADSVAWANITGKPTWIGSSKPAYNYLEITGTPDLTKYALKTDIPSLSGYVTADSLTNVLKEYVTISGNDDITGLKNFKKGLLIDGLGITKSQDDVIYLDANLVVRGGITMYADNTVDIPGIIDSLPVASTTSRGVASFDGEYFSVDSDGKVTLLEGNVGLNEAELAAYLSNNKYATQSWVQSLGYATTSDLDSRINALINGAPSAYDTLKEIADVLAGNVNSIGDIITSLGTKADKTVTISAGTGLTGGGTLADNRTLSLATSGVTAGTYKSVTVDAYGRVTGGSNPNTLAGYGITDAYTKNEITSLLGNYVTLASEQTITGKKNFTTGGLFVNGSQITYDSTNKYWKLEGDLLVTGGVTMYGNDSEFVPSTIMDAILYDDTTLGINSSGELYVKGSVGGSSTLGGLSNVGTWADSVADVDRIMYQASGSSMWVAKNLSDLAVGGVSGDYLPLTGGTISRNDRKHLLLKNQNADGESALWVGGTFENFGTGGIVSFNGSNKTFSFTNFAAYSNSARGIAGIRITNDNRFLVGDANFTDGYTYTVWHSGNDGAGSGLDADLLDGIQESNFCRHLDMVPITSHRGIGYGFLDNGWIDNGPALSIGNSDENYLMQLQTPYYANVLYFRSKMNDTWGSWKTIAFTDSNVASATKLQTARTIWGQSFDGTGNVDGKVKLTSWDSDGTSLRFENNNAGKCMISMYAISGNAYSFGQNSTRFVINHNSYGDIFNIVNGNVGIGITSPKSKLDINGAVWIGAGNYIADRANLILNANKGNTVDIIFKNGSTTVGNFGSWAISTRFNDDHRFSIWRGGENGSIASELEVLKLYANGDLLVVGGITMYSDQRKKTILNHVELSLKQIANAPLIEHYYNGDDKKTTHVGSIAQYWAGLNDWFCKKDSEGYYTMEIQNAALASAISVARELDRYESKTDKKIKQLKKRICQLEDELERLKSA